MTHKLLLADDSVTIQKVVELTFSEEDFAIIAVGDGTTALQKIRSERPDIILSDVIMPGMNGYDLCSAVKADPSLRGIPFLFLKGTFESFDEERSAAVGSDGFIVKPFESQEMIARVKTMIAGAAPAPASAPPPPAPVPAPPTFPTALGRRIVNPFPAPPPVSPPVEPAAAPGPAVCGPGEDFGFDFGEALAESLGSPVVPPVTAPPPAAAPETAAEMEEDLWSEVSLRDRADDLLETRPAAGAAGRPGSGISDLEEADDSADETLFDEVPAPRGAPPVEAEPEALRAIVSSLAAPLPRPSVDQAEIERIVAARMEAVVRRVLEPVVKDLARTVIETVSWEVIPDLAEAMIRAEIERIGQSTRPG